MKKINLTEYIQKTGGTLRLTENERARMKHVLSEYMSVKPIRTALESRRTPLKTAWLELYVFSRKSVAAALLVALLFSGAGISYAAESALPGDALYPLKVGVNEPVVSALSVSVESKASWNANLAERRLEEAEKLASEDKLSDDTKKELMARFDTHAQAATEDIQKLEDAGSSSAIGIASNFETVLAAHESVLSDVDGRGKTDSVKMRVRVKALALSKIREKAEGDAFVSAPVPEVVAMALSAPAPATFSAKVRTAADASGTEQAPQKQEVRKELVQKMGVSATTALQDVKKMFARVDSKLGDSRDTVVAQISVQTALVQSGDAAFAAGDFATAFRTYQEAAVNSGKLAVHLKAFLKLKIKNFPVRSAVEQVQSPSSASVQPTEHSEKTETNTSNLLPSIQIFPPAIPSNPFEDSGHQGGESHSGEKTEIEKHESDLLRVNIGI